MASSGLELLFTLKAKNDATATLKGLESQIASVKARMREIRTENDVPFKTQRLDALNERLKTLTASHKQLTTSTKESAKALDTDLSNALSTVSPQLAGLVGAAGPVTLVALGFIASAAAAAGLGKALFDLSASTSKFQGDLLDLSQQTGVTVETLSTLEFALGTVGGNLQSATQSLIVFQGHLDDAQDSGSKSAKQFKDLGVSVTDTEQTLRDTLAALARMPEGFEQTNAAAELFGKRGGKQFLALLKEYNGDLDGVTKRLKDMNALVTLADAKLADEFNDTLFTFGIQLRAVGATIAKDVVPVALRALKDLSRALNENREALNAVAQAAGIVAILFGRPLRGAINAAIFTFQILKPVLDGIAAAYERIAAAIQLITGKVPNISGNEIGANPLRGPLAVGGTASVGLPRLRGLGTGGGRGRGSSATAAAPTSEPEVNRTGEDAIDFVLKYNEEIRKLTDTLRGVDVATESYAVAQSIANGLLKDASPELQKQAITLAAIVDSLKEQVELREELKRLAATAGERLRRSAEGQVDAVVAGLGGVAGPGNVLSDEEINALGSIPEPINAVTVALADLREMANQTFGDFAQGLGEMVAGYVLLGDLGPDALRKMTASVLANLAQQATVKAIFELAEGFAALFFNPAEAAAHFQAAALYGSVAGAAAIAGRAIAGDAFTKRVTGGSGLGSGGGTSGSRSSSNRDVTRIDAARSQAPVIQIIMTGEASEAFNYKVVKAVTRDFRNNGEMRKLTAKT